MTVVSARNLCSPNDFSQLPKPATAVQPMDVVRECRVGARVCRGPDWAWETQVSYLQHSFFCLITHDGAAGTAAAAPCPITSCPAQPPPPPPPPPPFTLQDGGPGNVGVIIGDGDDPGWVDVRWPDGAEYTYRVGGDGAFDLLYAPRRCGGGDPSEAFSGGRRERILRPAAWGSFAASTTRVVFLYASVLDCALLAHPCLCHPRCLQVGAGAAAPSAPAVSVPAAVSTDRVMADHSDQDKGAQSKLEGKEAANAPMTLFSVLLQAARAFPRMEDESKRLVRLPRRKTGWGGRPGC